MGPQALPQKPRRFAGLRYEAKRVDTSGCENGRFSQLACLVTRALFMPRAATWSHQPGSFALLSLRDTVIVLCLDRGRRDHGENFIEKDR
jgi:hypothetical protein